MSHVFMVEPLGRGGIAHYTYCLATALSNQGIEVTLWTANKYEFFSDAVFKVNEVFNLRTEKERAGAAVSAAKKGLALWRGTAALGRQIRKEAPQVVHYQGSLPIADRLFHNRLTSPARQAGAAIAFTAHNILPHEPRAWHRRLYRSIYREADAIIAHCADNAATLRELEPEHGPVFCIPHGDFTLFDQPGGPDKAQARSGLGLRDEDKIVLFFGVIRPYKGLDTLIEAAARIKSECDDFKLIIAGNPLEPFDRYAALIRELGLADVISSNLAYIPNEEVSTYFRAADVVALPYKKTYQSGILQAALAFAKPVVATRTGGLTETIEESGCGFLVDPGDADGLARDILRIFADRTLARTLGSSGHSFAEANFSWETVARSTIGAYESAGAFPVPTPDGADLTEASGP